MKSSIFYLVLMVLIINIFIFFNFSYAYAFIKEIDNPINIFRKDPLSFIYLTGKNIEELRQYWPDLLWKKLEEGLKPVKISEELNLIAEKRAKEILNNEFLLKDSHISIKNDELNGKEHFVLLDESFALIAFENILSQEEAFNLLLKMLLISALENKVNGVSILFPCWDKMGYSFQYGQITYEGESYYAAILEIVFAVSSDNNENLLVGRVSDLEGNPLGNVSVIIGNGFKKDQTFFKKTFTFNNGLYCFVNYPYKIAVFSLEKDGFFSLKYFVFIPKFSYRFDFFLHRVEK